MLATKHDFHNTKNNAIHNFWRLSSKGKSIRQQLLALRAAEHTSQLCGRSNPGERIAVTVSHNKMEIQQNLSAHICPS